MDLDLVHFPDGRNRVRGNAGCRRRTMKSALVAVLFGVSACGPEPRRIPLPVPLPTVGGSRPAAAQGLQLIGEFGDGVWGQAQERVELSGVGLAFSLLDRVEFGFVDHSPRHGEAPNVSTLGFRGKIRVGDFAADRVSIGIHVARMSSQRISGTLQDERMSAWDIALPVTVYPASGQLTDYRWGVYAAPRLIFQTFDDRMTRETTKGTMAAVLLGLSARWRYLAMTGEMNFSHAPNMTFGGTTLPGRWIVLPMARVSAIFPIGD